MKSLNVERSRELCRRAHQGQLDKAGAPYYLHPFAVADLVTDEALKVLAYLHDTVEDAPEVVSVALVRDEFGDEIADALDVLTHRDGEPYSEYLLRVKSNRMAAAVKVVDLKHNMDLSRFRNPTEKDIQRVQEKYVPALRMLLE